mmetsp:Transcript_37532/g.115935  ORF Transcript_37532/g.115935 Transcript_37532/m.115935 type:complete len:224 (+) Transcript_37532:489-1160(+)
MPYVMAKYRPVKPIESVMSLDDDDVSCSVRFVAHRAYLVLMEMYSWLTDGQSIRTTLVPLRSGVMVSGIRYVDTGSLPERPVQSGMASPVGNALSDEVVELDQSRYSRCSLVATVVLIVISTVVVADVELKKTMVLWLVFVGAWPSRARTRATGVSLESPSATTGVDSMAKASTVAVATSPKATLRIDVSLRIGRRGRGSPREWTSSLERRVREELKVSELLH